MSANQDVDFSYGPVEMWRGSQKPKRGRVSAFYNGCGAPKRSFDDLQGSSLGGRRYSSGLPDST